MTKRVGGNYPPLTDRQYLWSITTRNASEAEVVTDATISENGNFVQIAGNEGGETNHLRGTRPIGGNVLFLDGHAVWRDISEMKTHASAGAVMFWF
jgi:prepilin-type processing-associated H-X9-DG protein